MQEREPTAEATDFDRAVSRVEALINDGEAGYDPLDAADLDALRHVLRRATHADATVPTGLASHAAIMDALGPQIRPDAAMREATMRLMEQHSGSAAPPPVLTDAQLAEIEARLQAIDPYPWSLDDREEWDIVVWAQQRTTDGEYGKAGEDHLVFNIGESFVQVGSPCGDHHRENGQFIANAPSDIAALLATVRDWMGFAQRLQDSNDALRGREKALSEAVQAALEEIRAGHDALLRGETDTTGTALRGARGLLRRGLADHTEGS